LYRRQRQILEYIKKYITEKNASPTLQEIAKHFKLSSLATVHAHLKRLEEKGYIERDFHGERGIRVTDPKDGLLFRDIVDVPIVGTIAAGQPILAFEEDHGSVAIPADMVGNKNVFCLKVQGDSMVESLIMDGDMVIVEKMDYASDGDTVVALLDDGTATVKKFFREATRNLVRLQPANPNYEPLYLNNVVIQGKVIGIYRQFAA
jgi:repressor LexA